MIAHLLRRLGAAFAGPPGVPRPVDYAAVPPALLRDVGLAGPHAAPAAARTAGPEGATGPQHRPFSFRIHPVSELVELRDRSAVASVQDFRHKLPGAQMA